MEYETKIYSEDSRDLEEILKKDKDSNFINTTITSPPYSDEKNYKADEDIQVGFGQSYSSYLEELRDIYSQIYNMTDKSGTLWVVSNTIKNNGRMVNLPSDIIDVCENLENKRFCEDCGGHLVKNRETGHQECDVCDYSYNAVRDSWITQDVVIWDKKRARPYSGKGKFRNVFEYIVCFSKRKRDFKWDFDSIRIADRDQLKKWWKNFPERYNPRGKVPDNIWRYVTPTQGSWGDWDIDHPAPFPPKMVERIINLTTDEGDVVFDPFAGSGMVLAQAEVMNRKGVGFEISKEYINNYENVLDKVKEKWEERIRKGETLEEKQKELEGIICSLRHLKYSRKLTKSILENNDIRINTVFVIADSKYQQEDLDGNNILSNNLYLVSKEPKNINISDKPSGFGITSNTHILSPQEAYEQLQSKENIYLDEDCLFLYANNNRKKYTEEITLDSWYSRINNTQEWFDSTEQNNQPAMISNIKSDIS